MIAKVCDLLSGVSFLYHLAIQLGGSAFNGLIIAILRQNVHMSNTFNDLVRATLPWCRCLISVTVFDDFRDVLIFITEAVSARTILF